MEGGKRQRGKRKKEKEKAKVKVKVKGKEKVKVKVKAKAKAKAKEKKKEKKKVPPEPIVEETLDIEENLQKAATEKYIWQFVATMVYTMLTKIKALDMWGTVSTAMYSKHLVDLAMEQIIMEGITVGYYPNLARAKLVAKVVLRDLRRKFGDVMIGLILMRDPVMKEAIIRTMVLHVFLYSERHLKRSHRHHTCLSITKLAISLGACAVLLLAIFFLVRYIPPIHKWKTSGANDTNKDVDDSTLLEDIFFPDARKQYFNEASFHTRPLLQPDPHISNQGDIHKATLHVNNVVERHDDLSHLDRDVTILREISPAYDFFLKLNNFFSNDRAKEKPG